MRNESRKVLERYARRGRTYSALDPAVFMSRQELERTLIRWLTWANISPDKNTKIMELGCGSGGNLLQFLRLGFPPQCLVGNELQKARADAARDLLPSGVTIIDGDALDIEISGEGFDIVMQSLVFSSLLDDDFQLRLADKMWQLTNPGGWVLWYDFIYDNPTNPDVRRVTRARVRELFPLADPKFRRITLAPPISRFVARIYPPLYTLFNALPFLRTHCFSWIRKSG